MNFLKFKPEPGSAEAAATAALTAPPKQPFKFLKIGGNYEITTGPVSKQGLNGVGGDNVGGSGGFTSGLGQGVGIGVGILGLGLAYSLLKRARTT